MNIFLSTAVWKSYIRSSQTNQFILVTSWHKLKKSTSASAVATKPRKTNTVKSKVSAIPVDSRELPPPPPITVIHPVVNNKKNVDKVEDKQWHSLVINRSELLKHYMRLSKIRLTGLVVVTSMAGYAMAPAPFETSTFLLCSGGTGLVSCAANSVNQFFEVPFDSQMSRTKNRVLVKGLLTPLHAVTFAAVCSAVGLSILYIGVNELSATLAASNLFLYTLVYTPMKRFSILNTWVGSVVGAIPPMIGWAGCDGTLGVGAWIMAGILYAWQFPHFNALSWNLRPDYSRAGYRMMAVTNPDLCRRTALRYTAGLGMLSCAAPLLGVTTWGFALVSAPLNLYFTYLAWKFYRKADSRSSRKLFRFSLIHLPALMLLLLLSKAQLYTSETEHKKKTVSLSVVNNEHVIS